MSLRAFHILFVVVTVILSLFVGMWGVRQFAVERSAGALALSLLFFATAAVLIVYGKKVFVKLKELP
ncbi:MAG TPA: hypothetical protein VF824_21550 [Thermoanaerobaculia bacterium]|jgi:uncharacterized PurR-regulated membrane protein YhhQ (DUF165 family)